MEKYIILLICLFSIKFSFAQSQIDPVERIYTKMRIDSLYSEVNNHISNYDKAKAINDAERILNEFGYLYGKDSKEAISFTMKLASLCSQLREFDKATVYGENALMLLEKNNRKDSYEYAIIIDNLSKYYGEIGKYEEAFEKSKTAVPLWRELKGERSLDYAIALGNYAQSCFSLNLIDEAIATEKHALHIVELLNGRNNEYYATGLDNLSSYYRKKEDYERGIITAKEALVIWKKLEDINPWDLIICRSNLAGFYYNLEEYEAAIPLFQESLNSLIQIKEDKATIYEENLLQLIDCYVNLERYKEAIPYHENLVDLHRFTNNEYLNYSTLSLLALYARTKDIDKLMKGSEKFENEITKYSINPNELTEFYLKLAEIFRISENETQYKKFKDKGIKCLGDVEGGKDAFDIYIKLFTENYSNPKEAYQWGVELMHMIDESIEKKYMDADLFIELIERISRVADFNQKFDNAIQFHNRRLSLLERANPVNYGEYSDALRLHSTFYSHKGNYVEAINYAEECREILNTKLIDNKEERLGAIHNNLGKYYWELGELEKSIESYNNSLVLKDDKSVDYAITLSNLASCYGNMGNFSKDIELSERAVLILGNDSTKLNSEAYGNALMNLGIAYSKINDKESASECLLNAYMILCKFWGESHSQTLVAQCNCANVFLEMRDYTQAAGLLGDAVIKMKEIWGEDNLLYIRSLANFAFVVKDTELEGCKEKAIELIQNVIALYKKYYGDNYPSIIVPLINLAHIEFEDANYDKAFKYFHEALDCQEFIYGQDNIDYLDILNRIITLKLDNNLTLTDKEIDLSIFLSENVVPIIRKEFQKLRGDLRELLWLSNLQYESTLVKLVQSLEKDINKPYEEALLNFVLTRKGLLLNSSKNFKEIASSNLNPSEDLNEDIGKLSQEYQKITTSSDSLNLIQIQNKRIEIKNQYNKLTNLVNEIKDFTSQMDVNYREIQNRLNNDEIAIEFLKHYGSHNSIEYSAIVLTFSESPHYVNLCSEENLKNIDLHESRSFQKLSKLIWTPLLPYLENKSKIYFSGDGELNNIPIESLYMDNGNLITDLYTLFRLSSIRELLLDRNSIYNSAILLGGLNYNFTEENTNLSPGLLIQSNLNREFIDELNSRGRMNYLPATKTEVENIYNILYPNLNEVILLMDKDGTENNFKILSGQAPSIIHIATHGKYWTENDMSENESLKSILIKKESPVKFIEDRSMSRSALFLSGANSFLIDRKMISSEDGIMTAKEIAELDLRGSELVVMSACQTGLGDLSGDGVLGLQRGFKKAGARSLLMSLWEVDDDATQMLMTEFYKKLMDGNSKQESLSLAQKKVRETPGFEDPEYWAAFILLDGLN